MQGIQTVTGQIALMREGINGVTWAGAKLALFTDGFPWTVGDTIASHTEASYPGYARQAITWGTIFWDPAVPAGPDVVAAVVNQFNGPAGGAGGQVITGWGIIQSSESGSGAGSSGAPLLLAGGLLDAPVSLDGPADALPLVVNLDQQNQSAGVTQS